MQPLEASHSGLLWENMLTWILLGLPADIRCCTKASCGSGGNCRFSDTCASGRTQAGLCPGPTEFKCCLPGTSPSGGFPPPRIPAVGACKAAAVNGAQKTVSGLPGKVREIFCTRDCACPGTSEHCCGLAIDFMCTSGGGVSDPSLFLAPFQCFSCLKRFTDTIRAGTQRSWHREWPCYSGLGQGPSGGTQCQVHHLGPADLEPRASIGRMAKHGGPGIHHGEPLVWSSYTLLLDANTG